MTSSFDEKWKEEEEERYKRTLEVLNYEFVDALLKQVESVEDIHDLRVLSSEIYRVQKALGEVTGALLNKAVLEPEERGGPSKEEIVFKKELQRLRKIREALKI